MHRFIATLALLMLGCGGSGKLGPEGFSATMNGANEKPNPVTTPATGTSSFSYDGTRVSYTVSASGLTSNTTQGHIHRGTASVAGPVVVTLKIPVGTASPSVVDSFTAPDTNAKNADGSTMTMNDLLTAMRTGNAYVNIHTSNFPLGEIRGPIVNTP